MKTYKPWTQCARYLDPVLERLHAATPLLIEGTETISDWVRKIPFWEIWLVDNICLGCGEWRQQTQWSPLATLLEAKPDPQEEVLRQRKATQVALRIWAVQDLARHCPRSCRDSVPWSGNIQVDLLHVLIDYWWKNGIQWASLYGHRHLRS